MQEGFEPELLHIKKNINFNIDKEKAFKWISRAFPKFDNKLTYYLINPIDFAYTISEEYSFMYVSDFEKLFQNKITLAFFANDLKEYSKVIRNENYHKLKQEITKDLPVSVVNYWEMASLVNQLIHQEELSDNGKLAFSLIASLFLYSDISSDLSEQKIIIQLLNKAGIKKIWEIPEETYYQEDLTIKAYFEPIIKKLKTKNLPLKVSTIMEIFLDRDLPYSIGIEQILSRLRVDSQILRDFHTKVEKELVNQQNKKIITSYNKDIKTFIDMVLIFHEQIISLMQTSNYNQEIIKSLDDVLELSMCLALYKTSPEYFTFFEENDLTIEQILTTFRYLKY